MRVGLCVAALLVGCAGPTLPRVPEASDAPRPTAAQLGWQQDELGFVFHYDMHVFGEGRYVQREARVTPVDAIDRFAPTALDTDQWVRAAKAAGARFAILTACHESGFRLWRSQANPFSVAATKWGRDGRDVVGEFHASCLRHGLKPGIYVGTRWNAQLGVYDFRVTERSPLTQQEYNALIEAEVTELCTRYGDWFEFWFDGGAHGPEQGGPDLLPIVARHQPGAVFYHNLERADARWGGSESGTVPYPCWATFPFRATGAGESARKIIAADGFALLKSGDPDGRWWMPAMSDAPLRGHGGHEWFWEPGDERLLQPLDKLVDMYCRSVGHNSTLILGATPDDRGLVPDVDVARMAAFGRAIDGLFGTPIATRGAIDGGLHLPFRRPETFDLVVLQEDVRFGERVRRYRLEVLTTDGWTRLAEGSCVGHKHIHVLGEPARGIGLRVVVEECRGEPKLRVSVHRDPEGAARRWRQRR